MSSIPTRPPPIPEDVRQKMEADGAVFDKGSVPPKFYSTLAKMEAKKQEIHVVAVNFSQNDPEAGDYGDVVFRRWNSDTIIQIQANPIFQKAEKISLAVMAVQSNKGQGINFIQTLDLNEQQLLLSIQAEMVSRALWFGQTPEGEYVDSRMTREELLALKDYRFIKHMFNLIAKKSGMYAEIEKELLDFLKAPSASSTASSGSNK